MKVDANRTCSPAAFQGLRKYKTVQIPDMLQMKPPKKKVQKGPWVALLAVLLLATNITIYQVNKEKLFLRQLENLLKEIEAENPQNSDDAADFLPADTIKMDTIM